MKKILFTLLFISLSIPVFAQDTVTLSTYYPAPFGNYDQLRLIPRAALGEPCLPGTMYALTPGDSVQYCDSGATWKSLGAWVYDTSGVDPVIYPVDLDSDVFVGIGTSGPEFKLELVSDGGILAKGTFNAGVNLVTAGAGTRLIWYPRKAAFRAGQAGASEWDDVNIGADSVAMGNTTKAFGESSVAMGFDTTADGDYSVALGFGTTAGGDYAVSMGIDTTADGIASFAMGRESSAIGDNSISMGQLNVVDGDNAVAIGTNNQLFGGGTDSWFAHVIGNNNRVDNSANAFILGRWNDITDTSTGVAIGEQHDITTSSHGSISIGDNNDITGAIDSIGIGQGNNTSANNAIAVGRSTNVSGIRSIAVGNSHIVSGDDSMAFGNMVQVTGNNTVGIGLDGAGQFVSQDDTLGIMGGQVGISTGTPTNTLHVVDYPTDGSQAPFRIQPQATAPPCANNGEIYVDTAPAICYCDGLTWFNIVTGVAGGPGGCF